VTDILPGLPVTRVQTTKVPMPRKILTRPVKKGLLEVEVVCSLATRNYKVSATVGTSATVLRPVSAILDTGAGTNLIRESSTRRTGNATAYTGAQNSI
jgi:hypothetical protein